MDAVLPQEPHFPVKTQTLLGFAPFFQNGDSFCKYVSHLHFAERLLGLQTLVKPEIEKALIRGAKKAHVRREGPRYLREDVIRLISEAMTKGDVELARFFAIARAWLMRVNSELTPLQANGKSGPQSGSWHSQVIILKASPKPKVLIRWHSRKNAPVGDEAVRTCSCGSAPADQLLCGVCALIGQLKLRASQGAGPHEPLFPGLQGSKGNTALKRTAEAVGLRPLWHAFRRGMATDMLSRGDPLAEILLAGGWKSGAFLRYLTRKDLDARVALEHTLAQSGDEA